MQSQDPLQNIIGHRDIHHHTHLEAALPISVNNVYKTYGKVKALDGVNLFVPPGTIMALLGPNGAGKTTLIRALATIIKPDSGTLHVGQYDVVKNADIVRAITGLTGQNVALDEILTGRENLEMVGRLYHLPSDYVKKRTQELLEKFELTDAAERPAKTYSGGMRRRLDLAAGIIANPKVLFLDEPTTGLDPKSRNTLWQTINELVKEGTTILLTTQYLEEADHLADRVAVINHGRIIAEGTADELKSQVGGDVVDVHILNHGLISKAVQTLRDIGHERVDASAGKIVVPAPQGAAILPEIIRRLDKEGIEIMNLALRRPTLDDVFLKLTGHLAEETQDQNG